MQVSAEQRTEVAIELTPLPERGKRLLLLRRPPNRCLRQDVVCLMEHSLSYCAIFPKAYMKRLRPGDDVTGGAIEQLEA